MNQHNEIPVADAPSPTDIFWAETGNALTRDSLPFVNQVARQLVTLNAAILAGSVAVFDKQLVARGFLLCVMAMLLFGTASALVAVLPLPGTWRRACPEEVREHVERGIRIKSVAVWISGGLLLAALAVLFCAVLFGVV